MIPPPSYAMSAMYSLHRSYYILLFFRLGSRSAIALHRKIRLSEVHSFMWLVSPVLGVSSGLSRVVEVGLSGVIGLSGVVGLSGVSGWFGVSG